LIRSSSARIAETAAPSRHKLNADDFHRMAEAGIFGEDDRIELIDGELIDMAPIGQGHAAIVSGLNEALVIACAGRAIVWPQNPIRLNPFNEPQPDLAVLRRRPDFYASGERPGPADVLLLIEVADSSVKFDQTVKRPLYARTKIGEYWIVNLKRRILDAYTSPHGDAYRETKTYRPGDSVTLALAPEIVVKLDLIFGS
jgi:Uma2 family endonuclease